MLAATGVLRGLQDTRTPLVVAVAGNGVNVVLNLVLVYGVGSFDGLGIAGSAIGTVLAQLLSAPALLAVVVRGARRGGASLRPDLPGIRAAARAGVALVVRTVTLRAALLVTTYAVTVGAPAGPRRRAGRPPDRDHALDVPGLRAGRDRDRRAGDHRPLPRRRRRGRHPRRDPADGAVGRRGRGGVRGAAGRREPVPGPAVQPDPEVHDLLVPVLVVAALGQPDRGRGLRAGRRPDRRRRRPLPRLGRAGCARRLRAGGLRRGLRHRRPGRGVGRLRRGLHGRAATSC